MLPRFVAAPTSVAGVSRVLALARAHGLAVVPSGAGIRLGWGGPPRRLDVVLSLARLDRVLAHEPADLTLSVECGATLEALDAVLRPHRQFVPLDPARPHASTIGGLIATGAAGPYRARYGTMRDLLVGLTVVRADGTVVKGGGRVVKNVSGLRHPEAPRRGARHPRRRRRGASPTAPSAGRGAQLDSPASQASRRPWRRPSDIRDTPVVLSRCQLLTSGALRVLGESTPPDGALAVTIGSAPAAVRSQGERIAEICVRAGSPAIEVPDADAWWRRVADVTWPETRPRRSPCGSARGRPTSSRHCARWTPSPDDRRGAPGHHRRDERRAPGDHGPVRGPPRGRLRRACPGRPGDVRRNVRRGACSAGRPARPRRVGRRGASPSKPCDASSRSSIPRAS